MLSKTHTDIILAKIQQGKDNEAINLLYKNVFPLVKKYVTSRGGNKDDAFDVFQDALIEFYKLVGDKKYDPKYKVEGYLYNQSMYYWLNKVKRDQKLVFKEDLEMDFIQVPEVVTDHYFVGKDEWALLSFFSNMGDKCKELLTYTIFYDLLMEDIAIRMGFSSVAAAKMQHQRCKQKMFEELDNNPKILDKLKNI
ncbi:MAG TPA: sigma-70 family RNA polymerase sigma factor [Cytophagales bacterium]|nr:sigma-70 family RNA polymerase sigma factor [Cytophagales bacterium]